MRRPRPVIALLALYLALPDAQPARAAPLLDMPAPATVIGGWTETPSTLRLPIGPYHPDSFPMREGTGTVDQRAYRMDNQRLTTLQLITPLLSQLKDEGYKPLFQCDTSSCGGFDFRYGMDVLPEPQMHVDLGDFRYVAAEKPDGSGADLIALLVSRSADAGYVQVTSISPADAAPAPGVTPAVAPVVAPVVTAAPTAQVPAPQDPDGIGAALLAQGTVALDDLVFASGSAALEDKDYPSLASLAAWLRDNPTRNVTLVGHTDASGALQPNIALSRQRAESVRATLIAKYDADPARITAAGAGYLAPRASNETPEGRTRNRRVEVMLTPTPAP